MEARTHEPAVTCDGASAIAREAIRDCAKIRVCGDRDYMYGEPENNFALIARLWNDYLQDGHKH